MAIAFVNQTTGTNDAGATTLPATAASHTTGNLLVVGVYWSNNVTANVPTDTAGNTYVSSGVKVNNGTTDHIEIFYAKNIAGNASNVVTARFSASASFRRIVVLQYSGCDTTAPFDVGGTNTAASGTTVTATATGAMAVADEVQCSFAAGGNVETWSCTSHTMRSTSLGTDSGAGDRVHSAIITPSAAFTGTTSAALWAATATFKIAGGAAPVTVTPSAATVAFTATAAAQATAAVAPAAATASFSSAASATAQTAVTPAVATAVFSAAAAVSTSAAVDLGSVTAAAVFAAAATATATAAVAPSAVVAVFTAAGSVTAAPVVAGSATATFTSMATAVAPTAVVPAAASSVYGASAVVTTPGTPTATSRLPLVGVGT